MIAEVYPLRRVSRTINFFDYEVPEHLNVVRGSCVEIPLRAQTCFGIVRRVKDVPPRGIRLKSILSAPAYLSLAGDELSFFESLAESIAQPTSNLLYASLPQPPARPSVKSTPEWRAIALTIPVSESATVARIAKQMAERRSAFVQVPDLRRTSAVLAHFFNQRAGSEKRLIVCPHVHDVRLLSRGLHAFRPLMLTGEESASERFEIWRAFRSSKEMLLIATRAGMLYADASTSVVCVVRSGHPDHVQHDRNPRLDNRLVMELFANQFTANLFFLDVCPLAEDLKRFGAENILSYPLPEFVKFINVSKEQPTSAHVALTTTCVSAITAELENRNRVLLIYNKKGYGVRLRCQGCDHRFVCSQCGHLVAVNRHTIFCVRCGHIEPIPLKCPACRSSQISVRGFGSERIADALQKLFPGVTLEIVDKEHPTMSQASLVLATRYYLENLFDPFHPEPFACVIHLDPDTPLFLSTFRATQRAVWSFFEWMGISFSMNASLFVQTQEEDLFALSLRSPLIQLTDELQSRREFDQPPFSRWICVTLKETERKKRELETQLLTHTLSQMQGIVVRSVPSERSGESVLSLRFHAEREKEILHLFSTLDDRYIIDMNAYS